MPFDPNQLDCYPQDPGVYLMKDSKGKILYIGKANSLKKRLKQYFSPGRDLRANIPFLLAQLETIETLLVASEKEALLLENDLIKKYKPKYNILLKDDKSYITLSIDPSEEWPKFTLSRLKTTVNHKSLIFGPYPSAKAARHTLELMSGLFPLRQCSNEEFKKRTRPCLLYDIKRCIAPCVQKCNKKEYTAFVGGAIDFLKGNNQKVLKELKEEMEKAAEALEFERAAAFLRTLKQIEHVTQNPSRLQTIPPKDIDVLTLIQEGAHSLFFCLFFQKGILTGSQSFFFQETIETKEELLASFLLQKYKKENSLPEEILIPFLLPEQEAIASILQESHAKKTKISYPHKKTQKELMLLAQQNAKATFLQNLELQIASEKILTTLQETLSLPHFPQKIECYDISHLSGSNPVAAIAAFLEGKEDKKNTRLYHMKHIQASDDYAALHQVLTRRLLRAKEEGVFPDLLIIDGGKGQLNVALQVLKEQEIIHIDVVSLVKDKARHDMGLSQERVYLPHQKDPIVLPIRSPLLFFLQKIRDKAHAKAIAFHQKTRSKKILHSDLDKIPGIGPVKRSKILKHFGSVQNLLRSSTEQIQKIQGLTKKDIENIQKFLIQNSQL